jgi:hypothetical protein
MVRQKYQRAIEPHTAVSDDELIEAFSCSGPDGEAPPKVGGAWDYIKGAAMALPYLALLWLVLRIVDFIVGGPEKRRRSARRQATPLA